MENFVVVNLNTNNMEATFSDEKDAFDYSIMLQQKRGLHNEILKVDDETLSRYLINFRADDVFLNQEVIFNTRTDLNDYFEKISKTPSFDFDSNDSLSDSLEKDKDDKEELNLLIQNLTNEYKDEKELYLIWNKKDTEFYLKHFSDSSLATDFIVNHLDLSKDWKYSNAKHMLERYNKGCDFYGLEACFSTLDSFKKHLSKENLKDVVYFAVDSMSLDTIDKTINDVSSIVENKTNATKKMR